MLYGENIKVPGEIFIKTEDSESYDPSSFLSKLRDHFENVRSNETKVLNTHTYIPKDLHTCKHVFLRIDKVKPPLHSPYEGPFPVVKLLRKQVIISKNGKELCVSIDRVKPAYTLTNDDKGVRFT